MNEMYWMILWMFVIVIVGQIVGNGLWLLVTTRLLDSKWFVKKIVKMGFTVYEELISMTEEIVELTRDLEERLKKLEESDN